MHCVCVPILASIFIKMYHMICTTKTRPNFIDRNLISFLLLLLLLLFGFLSKKIQVNRMVQKLSKIIESNTQSTVGGHKAHGFNMVHGARI